MIEINHISKNSVADTKLFSVLSQLNAYELNRLGKFVRSPYFNRNESLIRLLELSEKAIRKGNAEKLSKGELWEAVTDSSTYDDTRFRKLCSDLLKLIERFLIQEEFEKNQLQQAEYLLSAINTKDLETLKSSALKTAEWLSEKYYFRPASYYYSQYAFQREIYALTRLDIQRSKSTNIDLIAQNLDKFFIAEKLRYFCDVLSRKNIKEQDYDLMFMNEIIDHLKVHDYEDVVPINLYYQIYLTYIDPENASHFIKLKELMVKFLDQLPEMEAKEMMSSALNYCTNQINKGNSMYMREYLDLSVLGIQNKGLLVRGLLSPWVFRNIVVVGLRQGDFEWVKDFIADYQDLLDPKYRENAVTFNLANLYFYQKNYNEVLRLLQEVEYEDPSYNLNSKIMLMLTYYELDEIDSLTSLLASFEIYLRRNKEIPSSRKQHYMYLIRFTKALMRIAPSDAEGLRKLRMKIDETEGVVNKAWLLEKIDDLL